MMSVLISSEGAAWTFFSLDDDKLFLVETVHPKGGINDKSAGHLIRECRFLFGDKRIIYYDADDEWIELLHDDTGHFTGIEPYGGQPPTSPEEEF